MRTNFHRWGLAASKDCEVCHSQATDALDVDHAFTCAEVRANLYSVVGPFPSCSDFVVKYRVCCIRSVVVLCVVSLFVYPRGTILD